MINVSRSKWLLKVKESPVGKVKPNSVLCAEIHLEQLRHMRNKGLRKMCQENVYKKKVLIWDKVEFRPKKITWGTSLIVQWIGIRMAMQGSRIWSLIWKDPTFYRTTKLMCLCSRAQELQWLKPTYPRAHTLQQEKPPQWEACAAQLASSPDSQQPRPSPTKINKQKGKS